VRDGQRRAGWFASFETCSLCISYRLVIWPIGHAHCSVSRVPHQLVRLVVCNVYRLMADSAGNNVN